MTREHVWEVVEREVGPDGFAVMTAKSGYAITWSEDTARLLVELLVACPIVSLAWTSQMIQTTGAWRVQWYYR